MNAKNYELTIKENRTPFKRVKIEHSKDAADYARQFYHEDIEIYESFFVMTLNRSNRVTGYIKISQGGVCATVVDVKMICKCAIDTLASSVILIHNHPSGNLCPGKEDKEVTKRLQQTLKMFDVHVLDHIVLAKNGYFSFADEGLL